MPTATVINKHIIIKPAPDPNSVISAIKGIVWATDNRASCPVKPGQVVIFDRLGGYLINLGGESLRVVKEKEIMIILHVSAAEAAQATAKNEAAAAVEAIDNSEEDCE